MDATASATGSVDSSTYFADLINLRKKIQNQRITQGTQSGQITDAEQARLAKGQSRVDALEEDALSDGSISSSEFARIMHAQNRQSHHIFGMSHNGGASATASNAALSQAVSASSTSNASTAGSAVWADMNKLMQDIAQLRQDLQAKRIQEGQDKGQLTTEELQKLQEMQAGNADLITNAMSDGSLSPQEFADIIHSQNQANRAIRRYRHNQLVPQSSGDSTSLDASA